MVLSTLALFTAIPNSSSSTSESVCIVQAFVTVSILFRVRTLCPILYFQYILQNSEIMFSDWQVSVSHSHLIFSHDLTIPEDLSAFYCLAESASRILRSLMKLWKHFLNLRSTYSDSDLEMFWSGLKSKQQTKHRPSSQLFPAVEQYRN